MRKIVAQLFAILFIGAVAAGQSRVGDPHETPPGAAYFAQAQQALAVNRAADVLPQIQQGWAAVQAAGPANPGFVTGVISAAQLFRELGRDRDAESIYTQAVFSCTAPESADTRKALRHNLVRDLIQDRQLVKAEAGLKEAIADEESTPRRSPLYVAFLQSLAYVREQEGELNDAERILLSTIGYAAPYSSDATTRNLGLFHLPTLPMTGDPNDVLAAFYERHARLADAERLFRDQVTRAESNRNLHLAATRRLATFLSMHDSAAEAVELQKQIVAQIKADHGPLYAVVFEENTLARYEVAAGAGDEAKQMLESNLQQAENNQGRGSPEYRTALYALTDNRRSAHDYETAEKLAQQQLEDARQSDPPDPNLLNAALSQLAQVKEAQGRTLEAQALTKQMWEVQHQGHPDRNMDLQQRFNVVSEMIQQDKPRDQALAGIQDIAASFYPFDSGELYRFQLLAQGFLAHNHKPEGVQVAEIISSLQQREGLDVDPRFALNLVDRAVFYASQLNDRARASAIPQNARNLILECCGDSAPKMEFVLRDEAMINENPAAVIAGLERLREFEILVFGANNVEVENTIAQLAYRYNETDWAHAKELFRTVLRISAHRTGGRGPEYVARLDQAAMVFLSHHEYQTAVELNQRALQACKGFTWAEQTKQNIELHRQEIAAAIAREKR